MRAKTFFILALSIAIIFSVDIFQCSDLAQSDILRQGQPRQQQEEDPTSEPAKVPSPDQTSEDLSEKEGALISLAKEENPMPKDGLPLSLPDPKKTETDLSKDILQGNWTLDHDFIDQKGEHLHGDFSFDSTGNGVATLTNSQGTIYKAKAKGRTDKGEIHISTERFTSSDSPIVYPELSLICRHEKPVSSCNSTDGRLNGEHLIARDKDTAEHLRKVTESMKPKQTKEAEKPTPIQEPLVSQKPQQNPQMTEPKEELLSLPNERPRNVTQGPAPLVVPLNSRDGRYIEGQWRFDRDFVATDGSPVHAEFLFGPDGQGTSSLTTAQGEAFIAKASAILEDGVLKVQTDRYLNSDKNKTFPGFFIECRNIGGHALCTGTDGWKVWGNEHLLAQNETAERNAHEVEKRNTQFAQEHAARPETAQTEEQNLPRPNTAEVAANYFAELSEGGAELSPEIIQNTEKAKAQPKPGNTSPLMGDWRYSRDFARKSDGGSVALEFHFDADGRGFSVIRDGTSEAKASAESTVMPNGSIRVKTDAYKSPKGTNYFPTFMECRAGKNKELACDVSNGWMRLNQGVLLSKDSLVRKEKEAVMEELIPSKQTQEQPNFEAQGAASTEDLLAQMADSSSEPAPRKESSQTANLVLPRDDSSLSFLKGKWRCNTGLVRSTDRHPVIVEFSFDADGRGTSSIRENNGTVYNASARAVYKNGRLRINTSDFYASKHHGRYLGQFMECRQDHGHAVCSGRDRNNDVHWQGATFNRIR
ncbi:MAG: hypothetical protein IKO41_05665 [Lachnospiraceae bacterium]|nr:hypothetical protein [Lachnospiraceae bacterium]